MGRDYNIIVNFRGQGTKQAFGGGNLAKMNRGQENQNDKALTIGNLKGFASLGLAFRGASMATEVFGSYTEDRLKQRKRRQSITYGKYLTGIALNPALGMVYAVSDISYRTLQYNIGVQKRSREAEYYKRLSGNNASSGSRYKGAYS